MDNPSEPFLSVVVPAYNEAERISATAARIIAFLDSRPYPSEVIFVLDGGRPGAAEALAEAGRGRAALLVLDNVQNRGKGFSVRRGVLASRGEYVLFADADLSLPIEDADRFVQALEGGADVAIASRALPESVERGGRQMLRHSLGRMFNWVVQRALLPGVHDTQCGFKAFRGSVARSLFAVQRIDRFGFDVEVLRIARLRGCRIVELPVTCIYHESSSVRRVRDGAVMLRDVAAIVWNDWRGYYDAAA
jgi:glycosyltransferase involved in cell wall biosynthesis